MLLLEKYPDSALLPNNNISMCTYSYHYKYSNRKKEIQMNPTSRSTGREKLVN